MTASLAHAKLGDIVDMLATVRYLNEAVFMAAADTSLTNDATNAIQSVVGEINSKLLAVGDRLEEVADEVEFQQNALEAVKKVVDADALMASVRAELAKRRAMEAGA